MLRGYPLYRITHSPVCVYMYDCDVLRGASKRSTYSEKTRAVVLMTKRGARKCRILDFSGA